MLCPGQVYRSTVTVYDQNSAPGSAVLAITKPDGTLVSPAPTIGAPTQSGRDYTFTYDYTLPTSGPFKFTWSTTAPGTAPPPDYVNVRDFISIVSLAEVRAHLNKTTVSAATDSELTGFMMAATELVEAKVGTCVRRTITAEYIPGYYRDMIRLPSGPVPDTSSVTSIASLRTSGPTWAAADLIVNPGAGTVRTLLGTGFWLGPWTWSGTAGRAVIPERHIHACKEQIRHLWDTQRGGQPPSLLPGEEEFATSTGWSFTVPRRVLELLGRDMAPGFA